MIRAEHFTYDTEVVKPSVADGVRAFPWSYIDRRGEQPIDKDVLRLFGDLQRGAFWHVLSSLDGQALEVTPTLSEMLHRHGESKSDLEEKRSKAREWAHTHFSEAELRDLFELCVGVALTVPFRTAWPGTNNGHSILYRQLFSSHDSIFRKFVDDDFSVQLNNGRFWEELPQVQAGINHGIPAVVVNDVLVNHFADLDPAFARFGYTLFERNGGERIPYDIGQLSRKGAVAYKTFISDLVSADPDIRLEPAQLKVLGRGRKIATKA